MSELLTAIGPYLSPIGRDLLGEELPPPLAEALHQATRPRSLDPHALLPGMRTGQAVELVASVCKVLAEELSHDALRALRGTLPEQLARLFVPSSPALQSVRERSSDLASGRPGSEHPISEARPGSEHPVSDSHVEPDHDTLAEGRPGSRRSLSGR